MEKPIEEKYSGVWRIFWAYFFIVMGALLGVLLTCSLVFWLKGMSPWKNLLDSLELLALIPAGVGLLILIGRYPKENRQKIGWFLTDDGLLGIHSSGERNVISWKQIQNMKWNGFLGLLIQWNDFDENKAENMVQKCLLGIEEIEAKRLISIWREKTQ